MSDAATAGPGRVAFEERLALHTWTLDTTPLRTVLSVARRTGWSGVELRRIDFERQWSEGRSTGEILDLIRRSGLIVAAVGIRHGWMFAASAEWQDLLEIADQMSGIAQELNCAIVMSPVDFGRGDSHLAARRIRAIADLVAERGCRLALEFNSQAEQFNSLERVRELVAAADHESCGVLLDTYHLIRSPMPAEAIADIRPGEIVHFQFSDVGPGPGKPGVLDDRLPPGRGVVPFLSIFRRLRECQYAGFLSYEAPNPDAWRRSAEDVTHEARSLTLELLARSESG
ncbi:MAG: sugar phosphate isomerase/epimerase family protein [Candidatus Limnocylindria bacterium]